MSWQGVLAVGAGAAIGAWLRWGLSVALNPVAPTFPIGTLTANLVGGYLIGIAIAFFGQHPELSPVWRLAVVTGMLGGLTTFSTFSAEVVTLLTRGEHGWALAVACAHLFGSLAATLAGMATYAGLRG
jgi:CrcB protein